jgi:sterol desaturase/sphingolipid hydroxylase (fatty acid hydroxylase superfamily)
VQSLALVYVGLLVLAPLAHVLERARPLSTEPRTRSLGTDATYWIVTPLVTGVMTRGAVVGLALLVVWARGEGTVPARALEALSDLDPFGIGRLPLAAQAPLGLVLADLLSYLSHRARHALRPLSALHDVHHAPDGLSWSAAARMHPLDDLLDNTFVFFPLLVLGFSPLLVLTLGPLLLLHTIYLHANVRLSLGPLEAILSTPAFHRAHHAASGVPGNFGGVFTFWDRLFGTLRPEGPTPITGLPQDAALPETWLGQLVVPITRALRRR